MPLNTDGADFSGSVRRLCLDLQLPTHEFISRAAEFDDHGLVLIQSNYQMPDTLSLDTIPQTQQNAILMQNGATMRMYLPHAIETAQVQSFAKGYLETIIGTKIMHRDRLKTAVNVSIVSDVDLPQDLLPSNLRREELRDQLFVVRT